MWISDSPRQEESRLQMGFTLLIRWPWDGESTLGYPGGTNVILQTKQGRDSEPDWYHVSEVQPAISLFGDDRWPCTKELLNHLRRFKTPKHQCWRPALNKKLWEWSPSIGSMTIRRGGDRVPEIQGHTISHGLLGGGIWNLTLSLRTIPICGEK